MASDALIAPESRETDLRICAYVGWRWVEGANHDATDVTLWFLPSDMRPEDVPSGEWTYWAEDAGVEAWEGASAAYWAGKSAEKPPTFPPPRADTRATVHDVPHFTTDPAAWWFLCEQMFAASLRDELHDFEAPHATPRTDTETAWYVVLRLPFGAQRRISAPTAGLAACRAYLLYHEINGG